MVIIPRVALDRQFLAESVLLLLLVEGKDRERGEVLIHLHVILEILMTGDAAQYHVLIPVFEGQVIGDDRPFIRAGIVDIDRIYILVIGISGSDEHAIWKRSLIRIIYGKGVGGTEVRIEATFQLEATANVVFLIDLFPIVGIGVEAVAMVIVSGGGNPMVSLNLA